MEALPDAIVQYILSHMRNARDVTSCACVSRRFKESMSFVRSLYFPRHCFDNSCGTADSDTVVSRMVSSIVWLEELVVYCPFSNAGLASWLSSTSCSLRHLELRLDNQNDKHVQNGMPTKLDCIGYATGLESLKLWGVLMDHSPKWGVFKNLQNLEIVGAIMEDRALSDAFRVCPNLRNLLLRSCEGLRSVSIELQQLEQCRLEFYGMGNCSLTVSCPKVQLIEIQGCNWIRVNQTSCLRNLSISSSEGGDFLDLYLPIITSRICNLIFGNCLSGRVHKVEFGKLGALEFLSIKGVQWRWDAVSTILQCAREVKHLVMKVEFTGNSDNPLPFPEVDLVDFFNSHQKLQTFEIHGAMFAALCQKNSLKSVDSRFVIPCLKEVVITVRSPLNAQQKMRTLGSILKYGKELRRMVIRISQMKNFHTSADYFFEEIFRLRYLNKKVVWIE